MVTHNLNLTKDSHLIYLINKGSVHQKGTYNELLKDEIFEKLLNQK